jgi:hypothetical protein
MKLTLPITALLLLLLGAGCTTPPGPCRNMNSQIKEKQKLDAEVRKTVKSLKKYRDVGDTTSAASAQRRLEYMLDSQRLLKESLEQSSRDCSPTWQDPMPIRDPAAHDPVPK